MKLWNVDDLAEKFKVDKSTARRWLRKGYFPNAYQKPGRRHDFWVVPESDVHVFVKPESGKMLEFPRSRNTLSARKRREKYNYVDRPVDENTISEIIVFYRRGGSQTDCSIKFELPVRRITKILKESGVSMRKHSVSRLFRQSMKERRKQPPKELIAELYLEKRLPRDEILAQLGVSSRLFYQLLRYYEIPKRRSRADVKKKRLGKPL